MNNDKPVSNIKVGNLVRASRVTEGIVTEIVWYGMEWYGVWLDGSYFLPLATHTFEVLDEPVETFGPSDVVRSRFTGLTFHLYKNGYEVNGHVYLYEGHEQADFFTSANGYQRVMDS